MTTTDDEHDRDAGQPTELDLEICDGSVDGEKTQTFADAERCPMCGSEYDSYLTHLSECAAGE